MLHAAIAHRHAFIVAYLLDKYQAPSLNIQNLSLTAAANPDIEIFKLLHTRHPDIVNYSYKDVNTLLTEACCSSNPLLPH